MGDLLRIAASPMSQRSGFSQEALCEAAGLEWAQGDLQSPGASLGLGEIVGFDSAGCAQFKRLPHVWQVLRGHIGSPRQP